MEEDILRRLEAIEDKLNEKPSFSQKAMSFLEKILLPLMVGVLGFFTYLSEHEFRQSEQEMENTRMDLEITRQSIDQQISQKELDVMYVEMLYKELSNPETQDQALGMLGLLDENLQAKISEWILENKVVADTLTKRRVEKILDDIDNLENFKIGIYYPLGNETLEARARKLRSQLHEMELRNVIQLYPKNQAFFQQVNPPTANEIRYEKRYEYKAYQELKQVLESISDGR